MGWKLAGAAGMAVAVTGTIIPPIAILSAISYIYEAFASNVYVGYVLKGMHQGDDDEAASEGEGADIEHVQEQLEQGVLFPHEDGPPVKFNRILLSRVYNRIQERILLSKIYNRIQMQDSIV